jgi:hypothetical protein
LELEEPKNLVTRYKLSQRKAKTQKEDICIKGGLSIDTRQPSSIGRKYFLSIAKKKAKKEVKVGKQMILEGGVIALCASEKDKLGKSHPSM